MRLCATPFAAPPPRERVRSSSIQLLHSERYGQYAMILAAWLAGRSLVLAGTGVCTGEGDEIINVVAPAD